MPVSPQGQTADYDSAGLAASGVIKAGPARLFNLWGFNSKTSAQYIHVFNLAAVPANGVAPSIPPLYVGGSSPFFYDFGELGVYFTVGICWGNSSTLATLTLGSSDCWTHATYR
jgi:hypothetical protein